MRTSVIASLLAAVLLFPSMAQADPVTAGQVILIQQTDNDGNLFSRPLGGGPFRVDLPGIVDDFITFCLEMNEIALLNQNVTVQTITDEARAGGLGGAVGTGDPISGMTAFIYTQFRGGNPNYLDGFTIQNALWLLEDEVLTPYNSAVTDLIAQAAADMALAGWGANFIGSVMVMNLVGPNGEAHQDMLVIQDPPNPQTPIPEPATMLLLGGGLLAGAAYRRRTRAPRQ